MKKIFAIFKNKKFIRVLITLAAVIIVTGGYIYYQKARERVLIEDSLVSAPVISVSPTAQGKLMETDVYEGEKIKKGDPLAIVGSETLYSDSDGLIISANNSIGSLLNPQTSVVQMIDLSQMRIAGTIDENKGLNQIKIGQVVSFTVDALPGKTFWGYVDEVSPSAKQTQISFSISSERPTQQFVVYARFNAQNYPEIKNGMSAKMTVYTKTP